MIVAGAFPHRYGEVVTHAGEPFAQNELLWPDPEVGPYLVRLTLSVVDDRLEVVGIEMWGQDPPTGEKWQKWLNSSPVATPHALTTSAIRLPLDRMANDVLRRLDLARAVITAKPDRYTEKAQQMAQKVGELRRAQGGRPPTYDHGHWVLVAETYSDALAARRNPTSTVGETFKVSKSTAAKWVARCREMGLLPAASRGKAVGQPPELHLGEAADAGDASDQAEDN